MKGDDLTLLEQNTQLTHWHTLRTRGYPHNLIENITSEVKLAERKSALLQNNKLRQKICLLFSYNVPSHRCLTERTPIWTNAIQSSVYREKYTKSQPLFPTFLSRAKLFGQVSHFTACRSVKVVVWQHFDFKSADWLSDNLLVSPADICEQWERNLTARFSRRSWGRNAWRTLWERLRGRPWFQWRKVIAAEP